jgi:penicillin-binding protein 2
LSTKRGERLDAEWPVLRWYLLLVFLALLVLVARLLWLQIARTQTYTLSSLDNLLRTVRVLPPRGDIRDRKGRAIATDENVFALLYIAPNNIGSYFLSDAESGLLAALDDAQWQGFSALSEDQVQRLQKAVNTKLDLYRELGDEDIAKLKPQLVAQLKLFDPRPAAVPQWVDGLTFEQLRWLARARPKLGQVHSAVRQACRAGGGDPFLHFSDGQRLADVVNVAVLLKLPYTDLMSNLEKDSRRVFGYQPMTLVEELSREQAIYLGEHLDDHPGMLIERYAFKREYPFGAIATPITGYIGRSNTDPDILRSQGLDPREQQGKDGAELAYDSLLRGLAGRRDVEVNKDLVFQRVVAEEPPRKGNDLYLSIDMELQAKAYQELAGRPGAIVVSALDGDRAGQILVLATSPSYDPRRFSEEGYYQSLLDNPNLPLLNRAYRHAFPPGSTFKLVTGTAALQSHVTTAGTGYYCPGYIELGRTHHRFYCHERTGHGHLSFVEGFAESCDVVFYQAALALGDNAPRILKRFGQYYGYGSPVGIDLPGESSGNLPDPAWKKKNYSWATPADQLWYAGDTANYAIGQGYVTATPLQVLWSAMVVALDGEWVDPQLLVAKEVDGQSVPSQPSARRKLPLDHDALSVIRDGMRLAVTTGTCRKLNLSGLQVCAKSGTAEAGHGRSDHSWCVGFFPEDHPQFAFVCFFQNGGGSGEAAIPAARGMLELLKQYELAPPPKTTADADAVNAAGGTGVAAPAGAPPA